MKNTAVSNSPPCCLKQLSVKLVSGGFMMSLCEDRSALSTVSQRYTVSQALAHISHNCSFADAGHKRIMPMQCDAILGHWKVLDSFLWLLPSWLTTQANYQRKGCMITLSWKRVILAQILLFWADKNEVSVPKSLWLLSGRQPCAAWPVDPGLESAHGAGS